MLFVWYMAGAILNIIGLRWTGWKRNNPERGWMEYWKRHLALNLQSLTVAVAFSFVWVYGLLPYVIGKLGFEDAPVIERGALSSLAVGFVAEVLVSRIVKMVGYKQPS